MPRIRLLQNEEAPPQSRELFEKIEGNGATVLNLYRTLAHSPSTITSFIKLGNVLLNKAELSAKLRELAIMRIANLLGSEYEWTQHLPIALEVGVTKEQIDNVHQWEESTFFDEKEQAVLRYTDTITLNVEVKDIIFEELQKYLNERQIVELTVSIGYWGLVAKVLVPLQIEVEDRSVGSAGDLLGKR
jgi:alkylhydroperoxidase family enzyme